MNNNPMQIMMQILSMGKNPQQIMQSMMNNNPQAQTVFNQMRQSGMSPKQFVMQYAKQNNMDYRPFVNMLNQMGIKL